MRQGPSQAGAPLSPHRALEQAAERVRASRAGWDARALSAASALERLDAILHAVATNPFQPLLEDDATPAEKSLCRHLIDLLRRELLRPENLDDPQLPTLLLRMERLRTALEPRWHESLADRLTGMDARDLVAEIAHDLRSPLTSIMFLADTLRRSETAQRDPVEREQLGIIYSAALNLADMASNLVDLARGDAAPPSEGEKAPFSVSDLLERVRGMAGPMAEERGVELVLKGPDQDSRIGDAVALGRILLNLTTNALKFTDSGTVAICAEDRGQDRVEFSVVDTGRGMGEGTLATLFEPVRRSGNRTGFHFSGTGLGLAICRRMLEHMGSTLEVESRAGVGSRFSFELRLPPVELD